MLRRSRWSARSLIGLFLAIQFVIPVLAHAQSAPADTSKKRELVVGTWVPFVETGLNLNQSSYTANWNGGDKSSVVWAFLLNADLENQLSPRLNWYNQLKLAYGQTHQQQFDPGGERFWEQPEKSTDLIDFETIFRFTLGAFVDPYVSSRFESQFEDRSDPDRTLTLNPLKFKESAGIARKIVDTEERQLLTRLGATFRQSSRKTYANPAPDPATLTQNANDGGVEWVTDYRAKVLNDRVSWTAKLSFYKAFFYSGSTAFDALSAGDLQSHGIDPEAGDFPLSVDFDWENIFSTQITKLVSVNLYMRWVYDEYDNSVVPLLDAGGNLSNPADVDAAIRKAGQFKQTLGIGLTYRLL